jgi:hypothetical protein
LIGFNFSSTNLQKIIDCTQLSAKSSFVSLATRTDLTTSELTIIETCFKEKKGERILINGINFPISKADKDKVYAFKKDIFSLDGSTFKYYRKFETIDSSKVSTRERIEIKKIIDKIEKSKSLISKLLQIHFYSSLKLKGKVSSLISSIVKQDYLLFFYDEEFSRTDETKWNEMIISILEHLSERSLNKAEFETLTAYLLINTDEKVRKKISSLFDVPNRLSYVRERTLSFNNAARFPYAWSFWIEKYSSEKELLSYMDRALIYDRLKTEPSLLLNFYSSFPLKKNKREIMFNAFKELSKSTESKDREVILRLLSESKISALLKNKRKVISKPLFQLERSFYRENISKQKAVLYSIYRLLKLGLFQDEFLLYIYASRL